MKFVFIALFGLVLAAGASAQITAECTEDSEGYYPHETYCNKFYTCSVGTWIEYQCYSGVWNQNTNACDYPENVDCGNLVSA